jgi:hypothetical protein
MFLHQLMKNVYPDSKPLKPLPVLMSVRRVQRCVMNCTGLGIWATTAAQKNALPLSEPDHAHHAMKTVTKDATVQQGKTND